MGSDRSRGRLRHPLPAMQIAPDRISAADAEVHHPGDREHSFHAQDFSKGILLSGLPLHLGEGRRSAPATGRLGNVFLGLLEGRALSRPIIRGTTGRSSLQRILPTATHTSMISSLLHEMAFPSFA